MSVFYGRIYRNYVRRIYQRSLRLKRVDGYIIIYCIVLIVSMMAIGISVLSVSSARYRQSNENVYRQNAMYAAGVCLSVTVDRLNDDAAFGGLNDYVLADTLADQGLKSTCTTSIATIDGALTVDATASVHRTTADSNPTKYRVKGVVGTELGSSAYWSGGTLIGSGGAFMPILGVFKAPQLNIAGWLRVGSSYSTIGTSTVPVPVNVGNISCGTADWPSLCGDEPIQKWYAPSDPGRIYGRVCASGQTTTSFLVSPGLVAGCNPSSISMPQFDKESFIGKMTRTESGANIINNCTTLNVPGFPGLGYKGTTYNVAPNTRITGNLDLSAVRAMTNGTMCRIVFEGDVYIEGAVIRATKPVVASIANTLTSNSTIVVNRQVELGGTSFLPNASGKIAHVISFQSSNVTCSTNALVPSATQQSCLTTAQAKASSAVSKTNGATDYPALDLGNGYDSYDLSGMTFYAYYGAINLGCNNVTIVAIAAQGLGSNCTFANLASPLGMTTVLSNTSTFGKMVPSTAGKYNLIDVRHVPQG